MFDYQKWVDLLVRYIVVSNVPFTEVEVPEFVELLEYTHHGVSKLAIPGSKVIKQQVLKLSDATVQELKELFWVCLNLNLQCG